MRSGRHWVRDLDAAAVAYVNERVCVLPLLANAKFGQVWLADRLYCTVPVMEDCEQVQTSFVIRQQAKHPRLIQEGEWQEPVPVETGTVREQIMRLPMSAC